VLKIVKNLNNRRKRLKDGAKKCRAPPMFLLVGWRYRFAVPAHSSAPLPPAQVWMISVSG
jgi:hypothetical protein